MQSKNYPRKLCPGDSIAIIAPSTTASILSTETISIANKRFKELGLNLKFGKHINETNEFNSSNISSRVKDIHWAFEDPEIKAILTVIGGYNSNQLLKELDWNLIKNNPKIFCGYSDITTLQNAMLSKAGLVTYSGPHYSSFGQQLNFEYTLDYFKKCLFTNDSFEIESAPKWSDDTWYIDQQCSLLNNEGYWPIIEGNTSGTIIGGNLATLRNLQGTEFFPTLKNSILLSLQKQ